MRFVNSILRTLKIDVQTAPSNWTNTIPFRLREFARFSHIAKTHRVTAPTARAASNYHCTATCHAAEVTPEYQRVLALRPEPELAHLVLGMTLLSQGRAAEARLHLDAAANCSDPDFDQAVRRILVQ